MVCQTTLDLVNSLWAILNMETQIYVNTDSGNGLLPDQIQQFGENNLERGAKSNAIGWMPT